METLQPHHRVGEHRVDRTTGQDGRRFPGQFQNVVVRDVKVSRAVVAGTVGAINGVLRKDNDVVKTGFPEVPEQAMAHLGAHRLAGLAGDAGQLQEESRPPRISRPLREVAIGRSFPPLKDIGVGVAGGWIVVLSGLAYFAPSP